MGEDHYLSLQPGTVVNGRYEIVKCLGTGSMGMVYACRHRELSGHLVAMKVLFSEVAQDEVAAARFRNEIVASYGVSHPNVVRAYEYFRDGDLIAFTMEYIGGGDLADRINADRQIAIKDTINMLSQMCSGVQAIHDAGIIHRDLKPENILLTTQGDIKITDFGIARTGAGPKLTEHGGVVGTIDYVSPEYLESGQVDVRSDIYALGVLAYEMITSESPFKGNSVIETMTMRLKTDPRPPHVLRSDCPVGLSEIVLKALRRNPVDRYQTASEMLIDLKELSLSETTYATEPEVQGHTSIVVGSEGQEYYQQNKAPHPPIVKEFHYNVRPKESLVRPDDKPIAEAKKLSSNLNQNTRGSVPSSGRLKPGNIPLVGRANGFEPPPKIAVSQSHLSAQRMQQLSSNFSSSQGIKFTTMLWYAFVVAIGCGVGFFYFLGL